MNTTVVINTTSGDDDEEHNDVSGVFQLIVHILSQTNLAF
jgi:hypothetical protein